MVEFFKALLFKERMGTYIEAPGIQLNLFQPQFFCEKYSSFQQRSTHTFASCRWANGDLIDEQVTHGICEHILRPVNYFAEDITQRLPIFVSDENADRGVSQHPVEERGSKVIRMRHFENIWMMFGVQALYIHT